MKDNNPSAFPHHYQDDVGGMSLRDYLAGQALALIGNRAWDHIGSDSEVIKVWARCAYQIADAMIVERANHD